MEKENFKFGERLEFFKPDLELRQEIAGIWLKSYQEEIIKKWDKLKDYIEYNSPEETIKNYTIYDYNCLWDKLREKHVSLLSKTKERISEVKVSPDLESIQFEEKISETPVVKKYLSKEDYKLTDAETQFLTAIKEGDDIDINNENITIRREEDDHPKKGGGVENFDYYAPYDSISYFIDIFKQVNLESLKKFHSKKIVFDITRYILYMRKTRGNNNIYLSHTNPNGTFWLKYQRDNAHYRIENEEYKKESDKERDLMIYWATHYIIKMINNPDYVKQIQKIHNYIFNVLQFATTEDLKKLVKFSFKSFDVKLKGDPKGLPVFKFDAKDKHFICSFISRSECQKEEGMSKSTLSRLLNPKDDLKSWHKRVYIEISYDDAQNLDYNMDKMIEFATVNK